MKSSQVYSAVRAVLSPWCEEHGFRRAKTGMLGWYAPLGNRFVVFWIQCSQDGWDRYAGSRFTIEFQIADIPEPGMGTQRARLPRLLDEGQLEELRQLNNRVITKLRKPDPSYFIFGAEPKVIDWYLQKFQPVSEPYRPNEDVWLRYGDEEDVQTWAEWVLGLLPQVLARFQSIDVLNNRARAV